MIWFLVAMVSSSPLVVYVYIYIYIYMSLWMLDRKKKGQKGSTLAGTQMLDRCWQALKNFVGPHWPRKIGKGVTSTVHPALSLLVLQFQWRRSIGSVSSAKFLQELSRAFAERGRSWRKKLTLQLLTIYMILGMIVMMLKMMMLMMMMMIMMMVMTMMMMKMKMMMMMMMKMMMMKMMNMMMKMMMMMKVMMMKMKMKMMMMMFIIMMKNK